jgi:roadblock/LC7 domain-containing protein
MITIQNAIFALDSSIVTVTGDIAYDANGAVVQYDMDQAEAKLAELQAADTAARQAQEQSKASAFAKLSALGLTDDEIKALIG